MKKVAALTLSIVILVTLAACGRTVDTIEYPTEIPSETQQTEATPTIEPEITPTAAPEQTVNSDEEMDTPDIPAITPEKVSEQAITTTAPPTEIATVSTPELTQQSPEPTLSQTPSAPPVEATTPSETPSPIPEPTPTPSASTETVPSVMNISITVGSSVFSVKLYDNDTAKAFSELLPLSLNMSELNGNEKYYYLPNKLPTDSERVGSISNGDLMLYGSDCLVLFYESFSTSYSYTRLGYVEDVSGLVAALGNGSVEVIFAFID